MKPSLVCPVLAALLAAAGCGDNSKVCGPGTDDLDGDGYCELGGGGATPCSDGTIFDPQTNTCVIDPTSCQGGTVLIHDRCVDPTESLDIDLREGPEPNNAGVAGIEASGAVAGLIALKPAGQTFVVKGTINPFRDADGDGERDPDMDAYTFTVGAPTLLEISVDGVGGMMGAFLVVPVGASPAAAWRRFGLNVSGDTSKRQVFLPAAGKYAISVADTRSLLLDASSPPAAGGGAAAGSPDASYFMSITALALPAPTALAVTGDTATSTGAIAPGEVKLFTAPMGPGLNEVELAIPATPRAAVVVTRNDVYLADGAEQIDPLDPLGTLPARVTAGGFLPGDRALIVADTVYHYGPGAAAYTLTIRIGAAVALPRTGGTASQPEVPGRMAAFYYDVAAADEVTGFALTWNQPVGGMIVDGGGAPVASFTYDPAARAFTDHTFTSYTGLVRHRAAGRYYFLAFDPAGAGPAELAVTSTIAAQPCPTIVEGTPLAGQAVSAAFRSNAFLYDAGTDRWQRFNATGTGTGMIVNAFFDRATAYGRLDPLSSTGTGELVPDAAPIFWQSFPEAGGAQGRILLDDPATSFLVTTRAQTTTGAPTFTLDFRARAYHDFGTIAAGQSITLQDEAFDAATPVRFYLLRASPGDKLSITAAPGTTTLDTRLQLLTRDEAIAGTFDTGGAGATDVAQVLQAGSGWTALAVAAANPPTGAFDLTIGATAFVKPTYARAPGTTIYEDACLGGAVQPLVSDGSTGPASDEGLTAAPISTPAGFAFFGLLEPRLTASTNGWLSFGPVTRAVPANADLPSSAGPNALVAPYWDDLANVTICTKTIGTRLVVQWTGKVAGAGSAAVETQAILDGATGKIELVWGPNHVPRGAAATVGIEDQDGATACKIGYNTAGAAAAGTTVVLTPM